MHASIVPTMNDLAGLVGYVLGNPYLFISSSTVMTTGFVFVAAVLSALPGPTAVLHRVAPSLALVLAYFGMGSMALATEILLRFHEALPDATETQFVSGLGHLAVAATGIAILLPRLRGRSPDAWLVGNAVAVAYWTLQILLISPPWLAFGGEGQLARSVALGALAAAGVTTFTITAARRAVAVR
jgi:hypothetical protein